LRRPFSIHLVKGKTIYILFRIRGRGTELLSQYKKGESLNIIGPLGNAFSVPAKTTPGLSPILLAGGLGVAPLLFLADKMKTQRPTIILGAKSKSDLLCEKEFEKRGCRVLVATEDGSRGKKGTALDILRTLIKKPKRVNIYSCGPKEMFEGINKIIGKAEGIKCEISFEQFMGCGLGICCACTIETKKGYKKVCKDGPVFNLRDIW